MQRGATVYSRPMRPRPVTHAPDELDAQFHAIATELEGSVRRLSESIEDYRRTYERRAAAADHGDERAAIEALHRLHRLELVADHVGASLGYLVGTRGAPAQHDEVRELAARVLDSLESDRQRLYREVHDGPAQVLANAMFQIEFVERVADRAPADVRAQLRSELADLRSQLRDSLESVRAMIFELRPPALAQLGVVEAMRAYAAEFQSRYGLVVETELRAGPTGLTAEQELAIYRVLQEALENVRKHARARGVRVAWRREGVRWVLSVADDGVGFETARATARGKSFGLLIMRERAEVIGASFDVRSTPGAGTTVTLSLSSAA